MPGVVQPNSPTNGAFKLTNPDSTVSQIKDKAAEAVKKEARGASAMTLLRAAQSQVLHGADYETQGNLKEALSAFSKAASLAQMTLSTSEFTAEQKGKGGVLSKEFTEFFENANLRKRILAIEEKLKAVELPQSPTATNSDLGPSHKPGGSIADRMKALQDNGLAIATSTTRSSSSSLSHKSTPSTSHQTVQPSLTSQPSTHTIVPPSSFGPPSPSSSSPPSSPQYSAGKALSEFNNAFPPIDELDTTDSTLTSLAGLPSVPTDLAPSSIAGSANGSIVRNFVVPMERPSSTPITPTSHLFGSRPVSPAKQSPLKSSAVPDVNGTFSVLSSQKSRIAIPHSNTAFPRDLHRYLKEYNVLVIDVRNRADFNRERIKAEATICMEPQLLTRSSVTAESLEDAMIVYAHEFALFSNRDKFDLVAICDDTSTSFGSASSPASILVRAIHETAFKKMLKRMPMLLVGGIQAYKKEVGMEEIVLGPSSVIQSTSTASTSLDNQRSQWNTTNHFTTDPELGSRYSESADYTSLHARTPVDYGIPSGSHRHLFDPSKPLSHSSSITISQRPPSAISPTSISYPQFPPRMLPSMSGPSSYVPASQFDTTLNGVSIASPPQASISSPLSRRRSDYIDQSQEALSSLPPSTNVPNYPTILKPPPAAVSNVLDRNDSTRRQPFSPNSISAPKQPRIDSDYPVTYWGDVEIGTSGLKNLGNTCYMNAPIQCLSATVPFARFFTDGRWKHAINYTNAMGSKGQLAGGFARLVHDMWGGDLPYLTPMDFRRTICQLKSQYIGSDQHDSQEFLSFLIDGIHEDLNRIIAPPPWKTSPEQEALLEKMPQQIASDQEWRAWRLRNDSIIVDFFQGQFRSRLECLTCHKTSTTYNVFSILQLPIPPVRSGKVPLHKCLDALFNTEILEKDDAWDCPQCKTKRKATKQLSLARLPPILLIHLKRFEANGRFSDKIDTFVEYPVKALDLTSFMPPPLPPGADKGSLSIPGSLDDPRTQLPPYRYDLYGVTNHIGNLSSGHYTAFIASQGGWLYCDDSSIKAVDAKQVIGQRAYVLFYKRTKT